MHFKIIEKAFDYGAKVSGKNIYDGEQLIKRYIKIEFESTNQLLKNKTPISIIEEFLVLSENSKILRPGVCSAKLEIEGILLDIIINFDSDNR
jgi:hypothetical protein